MTAIPVTFSGPQVLKLYPDPYGCVFAQVKPGTYTVSVAQPVSGYPGRVDVREPGRSSPTPPAAPRRRPVPTPTTCGAHPTSLPQGTVPTITVVVGVGHPGPGGRRGQLPLVRPGQHGQLHLPDDDSGRGRGRLPGCGPDHLRGDRSERQRQRPAGLVHRHHLVDVRPSRGSVTRITSVACATTTRPASAWATGPAEPSSSSSTTGAGPEPHRRSAHRARDEHRPGRPSPRWPARPPPSAWPSAPPAPGSGVVLTGTITVSGAHSTPGCPTRCPPPRPLSGLQCPTGATGCVAIATTSTAPDPRVRTGRTRCLGGRDADRRSPSRRSPR